MTKTKLTEDQVEADLKTLEEMFQRYYPANENVFVEAMRNLMGGDLEHEKAMTASEIESAIYHMRRVRRRLT